MTGRIMITGTNSGCGKTTVTLALIMALKAQGHGVAAFKCGPDYIDPMFHRRALGIPSSNLDPFFCSKEQLVAALAGKNSSLCVLEGAMGYYDGIGAQGKFSAYDVALATDTPAILVVDVKGMYASAGALLQGFKGYKPHSNICGVIFNGASKMLYEGLKEVAISCGIVPLGYLPREDGLRLESRKLGLITADEVADIEAKLKRLSALATDCFDMQGILNIAASATKLNATPSHLSKIAFVRLAVARDEAFCFIYQENLDMLEALGCELCYFSPLRDEHLPDKINGIYLPGGYPELHLEALQNNAAMRGEIKRAIAGGMPTIAECGGFLYLHDTLDGYKMAGVINASAYRTDKLRRFGYVTLTARRDNLLCKQNDSIRSHEFHYYESDSCGGDFIAQKPYSDKSWDCVHANETLYTGFPHLYFPANPSFAENFVKSMALKK